MKEIICKLHLGLKEQEVFIYSKEEKDFSVFKMDIKQIPNFIANQQEIKDVYLAGPKNFVRKIEDEIHELETKMYTAGVKSEIHYM